MPNHHLYTLVRDFLDNKLDAARQHELHALLADPFQKEMLADIFSEITGEPDMSMEFDPSLLPILENVLQADKPQQPAKIRRLPKWGWAAAAMLVLAAGSAYWLLGRQNGHSGAVVKGSHMQQIKPGGNGAVLTLADGSQVILDSAGNGVVAKQGGANVVLNKGQVAYTPAGNEAGKDVFNTITTPRGKQFRIQLPDGTKVWLNAASSIRYPVAFNGPSREVNITGEAYFEVTPAASQPFVVHFSGTDKKHNGIIEVLGTAFNLNTYADEPVAKATLLQGSIRINKERILTPGEQAVINNQDELYITDDIIANDEIAWKNGLFVMRNTAWPALLRQISRWYNVDVKMEGQLPQREFGGAIPKNLDLASMIEVLEANGVHCRLENDRLIVYY